MARSQHEAGKLGLTNGVRTGTQASYGGLESHAPHSEKKIKEQLLKP
jgi:hypothetical protein